MSGNGVAGQGEKPVRPRKTKPLCLGALLASPVVDPHFVSEPLQDGMRADASGSISLGEGSNELADDDLEFDEDKDEKDQGFCNGKADDNGSCKKKLFKRQFRNAWRYLYPWVITRKKPNGETVMKCEYCEEGGLDTPWGKGSGCKNLQLSALRCHANSENHKKAEARWGCRPEEQIRPLPDMRDMVDGSAEMGTCDVMDFEEEKYDDLQGDGGREKGKNGKLVKRHFRHAWRLLYPWVRTIRKPGGESVMKCRYCEEGSLDTPWGKGSGCRNLQLSALRCHARSENHKKAEARWGSRFDEHARPMLENIKAAAEDARLTPENMRVFPEITRPLTDHSAVFPDLLRPPPMPESSRSMAMPGRSSAEPLKGLPAGMIQGLLDTDKGSAVAALQLIYFIAWKSYPLEAYPELCDLIHLLGAAKVRLRDENSDFVNMEAAKSFLSAASEYLRLLQLTEIKGSPYFSLLVDNGVSLAVEHQVAVYVTYLSGKGSGRPVTEFLQMVEVKDRSAQSIYEALTNLLMERNLVRAKQVVLATDGTSGLSSERGHLVSLLKRDVPHLLETHSVARLATECLAAGDAARNVPELSFVNNFVRKVYESISGSAKQHVEFAELMEALTAGIVDPSYFYKVEWVTRWQAVEKLVQAMPFLLDKWQVEEHGWYRYATVFQVQFWLHLLADVLLELNKLNKKIQEENVEITTIGSFLDVTLSVLKRRFLRGHLEFGVGGRYIDQLLRDGELRSVDMNGNIRVHSLRLESMQGSLRGGSVEDCKALGEVLVQNVVQLLIDRFPDINVFHSARLFSPKYYPSDEIEMERMTSHWLEKLLERFCDGLPQPLVDRESCKGELHEFVSMLASSCERKNMLEAWKFCGETPHWHADWPNLMRLWQIVMVIPASTVVCERGFSKQVLSRNTSRSRLSLPIWDAMMRISVNGPDMTKVDWVTMCDVWKSNKSCGMVARFH